MGHKAIIAKVSSVSPIEGADRIQVGIVLGETVVIGKDVSVGDIGVFFPVDLQLSEEFCMVNNLFREKEKNSAKNRAGFFDKNRRVRAQPFLGVRSCGLFMSTVSLQYTGFTTSDVVVGLEFDEWNGYKICQKYISESSAKVKIANNVKAAKKTHAPLFAEHVDTDNFKHYSKNIKEGSLISIHAKVHGTSGRFGLTKVMQELPWWKRAVNKLKPAFPEFEYEYVVGTRRVVLKNDTDIKVGFHGSEEYRYQILESLKPFLEKGMTVYGEIAGYVNGKPIMATHNMKTLKDKAYISKYGDTVVYSYGCKEHEYRFHVYRITYTTEEGKHIDWSQKQIEHWCEKTGFLPPFEVYPQFVFDGDTEALESLVEKLTERPELLTEDYIDPSHISEGVIIRVDDGLHTPSFYKSKSYAFRAMESGCEELDIEAIS